MASSPTSRHLGDSFDVETGEWDIFLSHSGAQKGFAKDLHKILSPPYNVFFDITPASLPLGDDFPRRILHAAKTCRLALVVLSNEYIASRWPMIELSAFIDAMPSFGVKVLPLFYELSPQDLKEKTKLAEWCKRWEEFASKDDRIKVSSWDRALRRLCSINGLIFHKSDGQLAYLDEIVSAIHKMIPPLFKSSHAGGIHGSDRLCKVLIDKFEELEKFEEPEQRGMRWRLGRKPKAGGAVAVNTDQQREQRLSAHRGGGGGPSSADLCKVSLLGVYGLPGSGKTTLCACLCNHFSSTFGGRVLHLKLPTDPTTTELVASAKNLLKLTHFRHHSEELMSSIVDLPQMYSILKASNLQSSRVFLVIDNISSQESIESVQAILQLGLGGGSRVILVARTLEILNPLLFPQLYYQGHIHYVCGSMRVPSINEKEAICVLMQPNGGLSLPSDYISKMEEKYSSSHREIIIKVARLCAFCTQSHQDLLYLPLALRIIGSELRRNGMDLEKWERQLSQVDTMVKEWKEDAVSKIVGESYEKLNENLKLIFLDVALFMVPAFYGFGIRSERAIELLSLMHECNPDTMKRRVQELIRLCFLDVERFSSDEFILVHDVFLEFAKNVSDASSKYYCRTRNGQLVTSANNLGRILCKYKADLRALIVELDETCERFEFPAGLSSVKVVIVRQSKSLAVLGLAGLTSLVGLEVEDCPKVRHVDFDPSHTCTLRSVKWAACKDQLQLQGSFLQSLLQKSKAGSATSQVKQLINKGWGSMCAFIGWPPERPLNGPVMSLASRLEALQVLRLEGTGITSLGDCSRYWPQLRVLEVLENRLEELDLGNLPNLKQFFFGDDIRRAFLHHILLLHRETIYEKRSGPRMSKKPHLLAGCPELEDVRICKPSCEDGMGMLVIPSPNLRKFWLKQIHYGEAAVLPDFASSANSLEEICVRDHWILQRIEFTHQFLSLANIGLQGCPNLVKITGLECLPNLRGLEINACDKLQSLGNLEAVRMLERIDLGGCPALMLTSRGLSTLEFLATISVRCCPNVQVLWSDLENLTALRGIDCDNIVDGRNMVKLKNLVNIKCLGLAWKICERQAANLCEVKYCQQVNNNAQLQSMKYVPLFVVGESAAARLSSLGLDGVQNLVCLDGIHCLPTLQDLRLTNLPQLTCLQGIETLINLRSLAIIHCIAVKEWPSFCTLVNMEILSIEHCVNLKRLEGCDKMRSLKGASFDGCENLEHFPTLDVEQLSEIRFTGCKFASIKAMVGWVLDEKVSRVVLRASSTALAWELTDYLLEKPRERMELAEQLLETLAVYLTKKPPALNVDSLDELIWFAYPKDEAAVSLRRGVERVLMEAGLHGRVSCKGVLQQCVSDAQLRASIANCLLQTCLLQTSARQKRHLPPAWVYSASYSSIYCKFYGWEKGFRGILY